jgi:hypothetical protein
MFSAATIGPLFVLVSSTCRTHLTAFSHVIVITRKPAYRTVCSTTVVIAAAAIMVAHYTFMHKKYYHIQTKSVHEIVHQIVHESHVAIVSVTHTSVLIA